MTLFEYSPDGGETWEPIRLPFNCHPFCQVQLFGYYTEGENHYRSAPDQSPRRKHQ